MELFRWGGDYFHLLAISILLNRMWKTSSVAGISGHSQFLYGVVFTTKFMEIISSSLILDIVLRIVFLALAYVTVYFIFFKFSSTYDASIDTIRAETVMIVVGGISLLINHQFTFREVMYSFNIFLEVAAYVPQILHISRNGQAETITGHYLLVLGVYRLLVTVDHLYKFYVEYNYDIITNVAGAVHTAFFLDLVYLQLSSKRRETTTTISV